MPTRAAATAPFFAAKTQYAGAFLLMPTALDWLATARDCFAADYGSLRQGLLTSVFSLVVGLERVFHLDEMADAGFARLCGGRRCPSRHTVGGWRRHLAWYEVDAFCRRTCPWHLLRNADVMVRCDEHSMPRWTKKFRIATGYVSTRNKYMRCEKLFTGFDLESGRFLTVRGTPGHTGVQELAVPLVQQVLQQGRPRALPALFDAGAGKSDASVRALWDLVERHRRLDVTLRAGRYPHRRRAWKQLPSGLFVSVAEPGVCVDAPPKEVRLAETYTVLKDENPEQAVRTVVCRESRPGPKKDRWHPLYTTCAGDPEDVLTICRARQGHEQAHRVEVHDLFVAAVPCGDDQDSPDRQRPRFHRGPLQMLGWLVALVYNAVADLGEQLGPDYADEQVKTLRRQFFNRPGQLYEPPEALVVYLDPFAGQAALAPVIDTINAKQHRLPWLDNRRLVISLTPTGPVRAGP